MGRLYSQRDEFGYLASDDKLQKRLHDNGRDMLNPQKRHLHHSLYQERARVSARARVTATATARVRVRVRVLETLNPNHIPTPTPNPNPSLYQTSLNRFFYGISPLLHKLLMKSAVTQEG